MRNAVRFMLMGLVAILLESCVVADGDQWGYCGRDTRLQVVDLDMSPDPISDGQRVREWRVRVRADERTQCQTTLQIRETPSNELVGRDRVYRLRGGTNEIEVESGEGYRFSRNEHCFVVLANIEGAGRPIDAARRFCAVQIGGRRWTLRN
jgi:hypothetical protein